jgi:hypothetical protein
MSPFGAICVLAVASAAHAASRFAGPLSLGVYQRPDGAITVDRGGDRVDPYFAAKALLAARDGSLDAAGPAAAWIAWVLPRQRADGRIDRFCVQRAEYVTCARADADDAMMALWMELLVTFAPPEGLGADWRASLDRASAYLATLRDPATGVYRISREEPTALFMDNVEVFSAFTAVAEYHARIGDGPSSREWRERAEQLRESVVRVFRVSDGGFRVSTQPARRPPAFYPDAVAQVFPITVDMQIPGWDATSEYTRWMSAHRDAWLRHSSSDYPWGLVALAAAKMNDRATVLCWASRAAPFRHGVHWNVLEEAIYLAFLARYGREALLAPCAG